MLGYSQGKAIGLLLTDDAGVLALRHKIWLWVSIFLVFDALFGMLAGLNRALGIQVRMYICACVCVQHAYTMNSSRAGETADVLSLLTFSTADYTLAW